MTKHNLLNYFPGGNTSRGFYSLWASNIDTLDKLIILKGGPGTGKSSLMTYLGQEISAHGYETEYLWCSSDAHSLDGIVFREIGVGIIDGTAPHTRDPLYPGAVDKIYNLGDFWDEQQLQAQKKEIVELTKLNKSYFPKVYEKLAEARRFHLALQKLVDAYLDRRALKQKAADLIGPFLKGSATPRPCTTYHRFAGATTPSGHVNYCHELVIGAQVVYSLQGKPGMGQSNFLTDIAQSAQAHGYGVELYHCGFEPEALDHLRIPELGLTFLNAQPPHLKEVPSDTQLLTMEDFIDTASYHKHPAELEENEQQFEAAYQKAILLLKEAKAVHDVLEAYYIKAMDFSRLDGLKAHILGEILAHAQNDSQRQL